MEVIELIELIARGEDSKHQFKERVTRAKDIAKELIAFSNSQGGKLIIGVADDQSVNGLSSDDLETSNRLIADAATNNVKPAINLTTENVEHPDGMVIVVTIEQGLRPCADNDGRIWVKNGSDKRAVTAIEEMQRMFQAATLVHADELKVPNTSVDDIDADYFSEFFQNVIGEELSTQTQSYEALLESMNLFKEGNLNLCGALLLARQPHFKLPAFVVKAVAFPGIDITDQDYNDSRDIQGKLGVTYQECMSFILANIRHVQAGQGFNSVGEPEIPKIVFEEIVANALIHRDYFTQAPIKLFVFSDRIEVISPGHLPNNLTIDNIINGNSNSRNPIISSFARYVLPYRGIGSGVQRALRNWSNIDFIDDRDKNEFKVVITRDS
ncbi:RNA-binding domain-containing protein [Vibrio campbellii]|uniref:RNA-binding domain-containing protein n=1 Tax=Vibrio campbellii TaxID=680 RepID=UPI00068154AA|nr:RNA-binding domain-containing protein [Vibrio campbellii]